MQQVNASTVRKLVDDLKKMKLVNEPGQNVESFANKIIEQAKRIDGSGLAPRDLASLVVGCFLGGSALECEMAESTLHDKADSMFSGSEWKSIVRIIKTKYCSLIAQDLWGPAKTTKTIHTELAGLQAKVNKLTQVLNNQKNKNNGSNCQATGTANNNLSEIICYGCGGKGHKVRNFPSN